MTDIMPQDQRLLGPGSGTGNMRLILAKLISAPVCISHDRKASVIKK